MLQQFYNKNILEEVKLTKLLPKVICALVISLFSINGHAWLWNSGDDANKETNKEVKVNQRMNLNLQDSALVKQQEEALKALQTEMNAKMQEITGDLQQNNSESALAKAKALLDTVRIKSGIDPKVKVQESFLVDVEFPENVSTIDQLDFKTKRFVIMSFKNFRGGLYIDIMNLSKRTTLLYVTALKKEIEKMDSLTNEDSAKIIKDLTFATLMPMVFEDKSGRMITVFDEDVANEDHTYMFNRELKSFLTKELKYPIKDYDTYKEKVKASFVTAKPKQIVKLNKKIEDVSFRFNYCMDSAKKMREWSIQKSMEKGCFTEFLEDLVYGQYDRNLKNDYCMEGAAKIYSDDDKTKSLRDCFINFVKEIKFKE